MNTDDSTNLKAKINFVYIPFVLGAITVFHSVPGVRNGRKYCEMNLSNCVLARIFKRELLLGTMKMMVCHYHMRIITSLLHTEC